MKTEQAHLFPAIWDFNDLAKVKGNGCHVFSCFSCGGGSSMGYKLAGFNVLGNCEIDANIASIYNTNLKPELSYVMDIRDFFKLPDEKLDSRLFNLDILDGSPPCTPFSIAGSREGSWGRMKQFHEGQQKQTLDDLFFVFLNVAQRLNPKIIIAENVPGLTYGKAKGYVNKIIKTFKTIGYIVQVFLLNAATMGVPQKRQRVFFIARRADLKLANLSLDFHEPPILFGDIRSEHGKELRNGVKKALLLYMKPTDKRVLEISMRRRNKFSMFNDKIVSDKDIAPTLTTAADLIRRCDLCLVSKQDMINLSTFPQSYNFMNKSPDFVCGMCVPPVMMAQIAHQVYLSWLSK